jgi:hypothetical protein
MPWSEMIAKPYRSNDSPSSAANPSGSAAEAASETDATARGGVASKVDMGGY